MPNILKKPTVIIAVFMALSLSVCAQTYSDSMKSFSNKGFRRLSFGLNVGTLFLSVPTGGSNDYSNVEHSLGYGANLKYQIVHWFALQGDFLRGHVKGNNDKQNGVGQRPLPKSFDTKIHYSGSINGVFTLGNINWLSIRSKIVPYISLGAGIAGWDVLRSRTSNQNPTESYLGNGTDKSIREGFAQAAGGLKLSISRSLNIDFGYRMHFVDGDNFDGDAYYNTNTPRVGNSQALGINLGRQLHKDKFSYGFVGLEYVFGNKSKPQLMFDNPAARMNSELNNQIDVLRAKVDLANADADGDGVADIFDKEPNTPAGCPVDTHGVTRDTDGDGVPDCKDKQLVTPTECQPVDADGVGKCPPPECCANMQKMSDSASACSLGDLPSLSYKGNSTMMSADNKSMLASVAAKLKESGNCNITITGYPATSKASQSLCGKRTEAIKQYLMEKEGISSDRIMTNCEIGGGDANTIDIKSVSK
jgi:outer membrane protein OmpA-like peptidoglycan-associated protein